MSQILPGAQSNSETSSALGNLQSVGPNNQNPQVVNTLQNSSTVPVMQSQTQSQQSQYTAQSVKPTPMTTTTSNTSTEFPQV